MCIEIQKTFEVEHKILSLHPSGLYMLAASDSKVSFMDVLVGDLAIFRELNINKPSVIEFSNTGQFFAVSNNRNICIWDFFKNAKHPELVFTDHSKLGKFYLFIYK